ncbi:MAG: hypothetical protein A2007_01895 [Verrucomicrobia bacterium GWC2_42_7]|nr:MAG: hypothetical protein A2007_01895 [Verrucomicrobia bacterium GWC2_42_7]
MKVLLNLLVSPAKAVFYAVIGAMFYLPIIIVLIFVFLNSWIPPFSARILERLTKFPVKVEKSDVRLIEGKFSLIDLSLYNPAKYDQKEGMKIRELDVSIKWGEQAKPYRKIEKIVIDIESVTWVRSKKGEINITEFSKNISPFIYDLLDDKIKYHINTLFLKIGKIRIIDGTNEGHVREFKLNYNKEFNNILNVTDRSVVVLNPQDVKTVLNTLNQDITSLGFNFMVRSVTAAYIK